MAVPWWGRGLGVVGRGRGVVGRGYMALPDPPLSGPALGFCAGTQGPTLRVKLFGFQCVFTHTGVHTHTRQCKTLAQVKQCRSEK